MARLNSEAMAVRIINGTGRDCRLLRGRHMTDMWTTDVPWHRCEHSLGRRPPYSRYAVLKPSPPTWNNDMRELRQLTNATHVEFSRFAMTTQHAVDFATVLHQSTFVVSLGFIDCRVEDDVAAILSNALWYNMSVQALRLFDTSMSCDTMSRMTENSAWCRNLQVLFFFEGSCA